MDEYFVAFYNFRTQDYDWVLARSITDFSDYMPRAALPLYRLRVEIMGLSPENAAWQTWQDCLPPEKQEN